MAFYNGHMFPQDMFSDAPDGGAPAAPAVAAGVSPLLHNLNPEQLAAVIDDTVTVFIQCQIAAAIQHGDLFFLAIGIQIKIKGLIRHFCHISIQVDHQRIMEREFCYIELLFVVFLASAAHIYIYIKIDLSAILGTHGSHGREAGLVGRGTETADVIAQRLARAYEESEGMDAYDYIVVNDDLDVCAAEVQKFVEAAKNEPSRRREFIKEIREELKGFAKGAK